MLAEKTLNTSAICKQDRQIRVIRSVPGSWKRMPIPIPYCPVRDTSLKPNNLRTATSPRTTARTFGLRRLLVRALGRAAVTWFRMSIRGSTHCPSSRLGLRKQVVPRLPSLAGCRKLQTYNLCFRIVICYEIVPKSPPNPPNGWMKKTNN